MKKNKKISKFVTDKRYAKLTWEEYRHKRSELLNLNSNAYFGVRQNDIPFAIKDKASFYAFVGFGG